MIATLSKDDMEEMLGNPAPSYSREADEFSDLEVELVEYD
jgi:hypothetical protein